MRRIFMPRLTADIPGGRPRHDLSREWRACVSALIVGISCAPAVSALPSQAPKCMAADSNSEYVIGVLSNIVTASDSAGVAFRMSLGLPTAAADEITLVADDATCTRAAQVIDRGSGISNPSRRVYLIQIGNRFVITDPVYLAGPGEKALSIYTDEFVYLNSFRL